MKQALFIGAIASILTINSVLADTTVTSKTYVDTTRQATIPATGTNASTPGTTVVTYTNAAGTIGERGICNDPDEDDCNDGDLVTNSLLNSTMDWVAGELESATDLPETTVTYKTCYQEVNGECILWNLTDKNVYGRCHSDTDCTWLDCSNNPNGQYYHCSNNGQCECDAGR